MKEEQELRLHVGERYTQPPQAGLCRVGREGQYGRRAAGWAPPMRSIDGTRAEESKSAGVGRVELQVVVARVDLGSRRDLEARRERSERQWQWDTKARITLKTDFQPMPLLPM